MATIAFICIGATGHVLPTLPVVSELLARGETILYFTPERFRAQVEAAGAQWRPYGSILLTTSSKEAQPRRRGNPSFEHVAARLAQDTASALPPLVEELACRRPDVLVCDTYAFAGQLAGEHLGIPTARSNPTYVLSDHFNYYLETDPAKPLKAASAPASPARYDEVMAPLLARYGLPHRSFLEQRTRPVRLDIVYVSREFHPCAAELGDRVVFVGPSINPMARRFGEPVTVDAAPYGALIYVSLGTVYTYDPVFYYLCMEALAPLDARVVMRVDDVLRERLAEDAPPNFVLASQVAQLDILSRADLFVTHAGMGSTMESLYFGVPMLAVPQIFEQAATAKRIEQLGAGLYVPREELSISRLERSAAALLREPSYRKRAQALGEAAKRDGGYVRACNRIQELARSSSVGRVSTWPPRPSPG